MSGAVRAPEYSPRPDELLTRECVEDPAPLFARLRREHPISRIAETGVHLVATWDLIDEVLQREVDFSANLTGVLVRGEDGQPDVFELPQTGARQVIATADDPRHAVHRRLAQPRLAATQTARLEDTIRAWSLEALLPWLEAGGGDFVPVAERIPARTVANVLGLPDGDVSKYRVWAMMGGDMLAGAVGPDVLARLAAETEKMLEYLRVHLNESRRNAATDPGAPLLHALGRGVAAGEIAELEAIGIAMVMFGAGGESTAALIEMALQRLAADPGTANQLRSEPKLISRFIEEVARLDSPFKFHYRVVRRDCELGGAKLERGDRLMLLWASANRDESRFEDPDELRLDRRHPKHHLSFGRGGHFCIGAPLARLEAQVLCEEVLARTDTLSLLHDDPPIFAQSIFVRRLERLPIAVRANRSGYAR